MDWENERYVRVYVRDTTDWLSLSWQARAVYLGLMLKVDLAGFLDLGGHGVTGLAAMIRVPEDVVASATVELRAHGFAYVSDAMAEIPRFVEMQTSRSARNVCRARALDGSVSRPPRDASVLDRDGWRCRYCDAPLTAEFSHVDHVIPRSRGGTDDPGNLVAACPPCNLSKGAKTPEEWLS